MKTPAKDRTLFLKEQALEVVNRLGELEQILNHGIARAYNCPALRIWYTDPETSECDEFYHLDVWDSERKVLSVVWLANEPSEIVTFKQGSWETFFVA